MRLLRPLLTALGLLAAWQLLVWATAVPPFMLPPPLAVLRVLAGRWPLLLQHGLVTLAEIAAGLLLGAMVGGLTALLLAASAAARRWLLPLLIVSQALPVFALAPLLVLWLGYGMASKVAMAVLIIYFPVTLAFLDGLRRTEPGWLELARIMGAGRGAVLRHIRLPAALPAAGAGLKIAVAVAPIGAVIGEWVGASAGLGYLMLQANARMQADLLFAALLLLGLIGVGLYAAADMLVRRAIPWAPGSRLAD